MGQPDCGGRGDAVTASRPPEGDGALLHVTQPGAHPQVPDACQTWSRRAQPAAGSLSQKPQAMHVTASRATGHPADSVASTSLCPWQHKAPVSPCGPGRDPGSLPPTAPQTPCIQTSQRCPGAITPSGLSSPRSDPENRRPPRTSRARGGVGCAVSGGISPNLPSTGSLGVGSYRPRRRAGLSWCLQSAPFCRHSEPSAGRSSSEAGCCPGPGSQSHKCRRPADLQERQRRRLSV